MAHMYSKALTGKKKVSDFNLSSVDGKKYSLTSFKEAKILVIIFTCNHCPYAQAVEDRLIAIQNDYRSQRVQLVAINSNDDRRYPEDSFEKMIQRVEEKRFPFPYLRDDSQEIAKAYQAVCTPDIFVVNERREIVCVTRVDDSWDDPSRVTRSDLRLILDALLAKKELPFEPKPSMGCSIKWK